MDEREFVVGGKEHIVNIKSLLNRSDRLDQRVENIFLRIVRQFEYLFLYGMKELHSLKLDLKYWTALAESSDTSRLMSTSLCHGPQIFVKYFSTKLKKFNSFRNLFEVSTEILDEIDEIISHLNNAIFRFELYLGYLDKASKYLKIVYQDSRTLAREKIISKSASAKCRIVILTNSIRAFEELVECYDRLRVGFDLDLEETSDSVLERIYNIRDVINGHDEDVNHFESEGYNDLLEILSKYQYRND